MVCRNGRSGSLHPVEFNHRRGSGSRAPESSIRIDHHPARVREHDAVQPYEAKIALFDEGIGPNASHEFFFGDQYARTLDERGEDFERTRAKPKTLLAFEQKLLCRNSRKDPNAKQRSTVTLVPSATFNNL